MLLYVLHSVRTVLDLYVLGWWVNVPRRGLPAQPTQAQGQTKPRQTVDYETSSGKEPSPLAAHFLCKAQ